MASCLRPMNKKHTEELSEFLEAHISNMLVREEEIYYPLKVPSSTTEKLGIKIQEEFPYDKYKITFSSSNISKEVLKEILELLI